jgi:hypothetical protein
LDLWLSLVRLLCLISFVWMHQLHRRSKRYCCN